MYYTRTGQLELSCANCHEDNAGKMIRADHLSQGQINGFPTYRLKKAALVSIQNRFKGCVRDTRAETYKEGSPELHAWSFTSPRAARAFPWKAWRSDPDRPGGAGPGMTGRRPTDNKENAI